MMSSPDNFGWSYPPGVMTLPGEGPVPEDWELCSACEEEEPPEHMKDSICKQCGEDCDNCGHRFHEDDVSKEDDVTICKDCVKWLKGMEEEMKVPEAPLPID